MAASFSPPTLWLAIISFVVSTTSVSTPLQSAMYPRALDSSSLPDNDEAVVLVGNAGSETIDYLQFTHSSLPAINARNIMLLPGGVVAIPIPVGTKSLSLSNYTVAGRPGGYFFNGMSTGFVPVNTPPIDINSRGVYFVATISSDRRSTTHFDTRPSSALLSKLKGTRPKISTLKAMNFTWPK
jgi:hypothetical protein